MYLIGADNLGLTAGGVKQLDITTSSATFAGKVGIDSSGYTQKQLHIGDEGQMLLSHNSDTVGEYAGIFMRAESDEDNGMLRTKGLIAFERTESWGIGSMKFCVRGTGDNTAVTISDVALTLDKNKNATFSGNVTSKSNAKFWVRFDMYDSNSIEDSYNVSGVTDHATGDAQFSFSWALPSTLYCLTGSCHYGSGTDDTGVLQWQSGNLLSSSVRVHSKFVLNDSDGAFVNYDAEETMVVIFDN